MADAKKLRTGGAAVTIDQNQCCLLPLCLREGCRSPLLMLLSGPSVADCSFAQPGFLDSPYDWWHLSCTAKALKYLRKGSTSPLKMATERHIHSFDNVVGLARDLAKDVDHVLFALRRRGFGKASLWKDTLSDAKTSVAAVVHAIAGLLGRTKIPTARMKALGFPLLPGLRRIMEGDISNPMLQQDVYRCIKAWAKAESFSHREEQDGELWGTSQFVTPILKGMERHIVMSDVRMAACETLYDMCKTRSYNHQCVLAARGIETILNVTSSVLANARRVAAICELLRFLTKPSDGTWKIDKVSISEPVCKRIASAGGVTVLLKALNIHPDDDEVQRRVCTLLGDVLAVFDTGSPLSPEGGSLSHALHEALRRARSHKVQRSVLRALRYHAVRAAITDVIADVVRTMEALLPAAATNDKDAKLALKHCVMILGHSVNHPRTKAAVLTAGAVSMVVAAMEDVSKSDSIQAAGCFALSKFGRCGMLSDCLLRATSAVLAAIRPIPETGIWGLDFLTNCCRVDGGLACIACLDPCPKLLTFIPEVDDAVDAKDLPLVVGAMNLLFELAAYEDCRKELLALAPGAKIVRAAAAYKNCEEIKSSSKQLLERLSAVAASESKDLVLLTVALFSA